MIFGLTSLVPPSHTPPEGKQELPIKPAGDEQTELTREGRVDDLSHEQDTLLGKLKEIVRKTIDAYNETVWRLGLWGVPPMDESNWDTAGCTPDDIPKLLEDIRGGLTKSREFDSKSLFNVNLDSNV